jgi:hypothetical protein
MYNVILWHLNIFTLIYAPYQSRNFYTKHLIFLSDSNQTEFVDRFLIYVPNTKFHSHSYVDTLSNRNVQLLLFVILKHIMRGRWVLCSDLPPPLAA